MMPNDFDACCRFKPAFRRRSNFARSLRIEFDYCSAEERGKAKALEADAGGLRITIMITTANRLAMHMHLEMSVFLG